MVRGGLWLGSRLDDVGVHRHLQACGRVKVRVHHDGDRYEFAHAVIAHNPASCPKCRSNATPQHLPSLSQRTQAPRTGPDIGGTSFPNGGSTDAPRTGVPANRTDSDDDDTPLDCLARAATGLNLLFDACSSLLWGTAPAVGSNTTGAFRHLPATDLTGWLFPSPNPTPLSH